MPDASHGHGHPPAPDGQAEILDLDAEVLAEDTASIIEWLPIEASPRQIVDLGCEPAPAPSPCSPTTSRRTSPPSTPQSDTCTTCTRRPVRTEWFERVHTVQPDLDATWPDLGAPDLVWASAALHHRTDPAHTLRQVHDTLAPGGLFAVVELAGFPRFLPENAPEDRPDLEERLHAASDRHHGEHVPHRGADWGPKLAAAGSPSRAHARSPSTSSSPAARQSAATR